MGVVALLGSSSGFPAPPLPDFRYSLLCNFTETLDRTPNGGAKNPEEDPKSAKTPILHTTLWCPNLAGIDARLQGLTAHFSHHSTSH